MGQSGRARGLCDEPRIRPSEPRGRGDQPDAGRGPGHDPLPPEPVPPLARAAAAAGGARGACLGRRGASTRPATARRPTARRRSSWPARVHAEAMARVDEEAARLRDQGTRPFSATSRRYPWSPPSARGVPGFLLANFTWADIYAPHARKLGGEARGSSPSSAAPTATPPPCSGRSRALRLSGFAPVIEVGMVVTPGRDRRAELRSALGLGPATGSSIFTSADTARTTSAGNGWRSWRIEGSTSSGSTRRPAGPLPNLHVVPADRVDRGRPRGVGRRDRGQGGLRHGLRGDGRRDPDDLSAPHRVRRAPRPRPRTPRLGGGVPASARDFAELRLERLLDRAFALRPGPPPFPPTVRRAGRRATWRECLSGECGRMTRGWFPRPEHRSQSGAH